MPDFRRYMLNAEGEILFGDIIIAETLDAALLRTFVLVRTKNQNRPASRMIWAFEVWSGADRLSPERLDARPTSKRVTRSLAFATTHHAFAV
jgi:hypothetical protein